MANMSYCRFRNTLSDLQDCYEALGDIRSLDDIEDAAERKAARKLILLCGDMAEDGDDILLGED